MLKTGVKEDYFYPQIFKKSVLIDVKSPAEVL